MVRWAFVTALSTLSLYAAPYWIQVSSVTVHKKIAPAFIEKIKQSGFSYKIVEEQGRKKVRLGSFTHYKEALKTLPKVRCKIAYDAFIVPHTPKKAPTTSIAKQPSSVNVGPVVAEPIKVKVAPPKRSDVRKSCECVYDVHLLRKTELENALSYYKHTPYYEFNATE